MKRYLTFLVLSLAGLWAIDVDDLRKKAQQKTDAVREESTRKRERILARFGEFKSDLQKLKPGLTIEIPIDTTNASKMRLIDHNELTGIPEVKKVFAVVTEDYTLKTWHSDSDSDKLEKVRAGEHVEVLMIVNPRDTARSSVWALVRTVRETEGYLPERLLKNVPEQAKPSTKVKEQKYVIAPTGLKLRSEASLAGDFIILVPYDTELQVTAYSASKDTIDGTSDYWAEVTYENQKGWVFNAYLRPLKDKPAPEPVKPNASGFTFPVDGTVNSKFGPRIDPVTKKSGDFHRGIDIMAPTGEPIKAAKTGEVYENATNKWWGNYIIIKHESNLFTYYCHQSRTKSRKGERVTAGDTIGFVGKTGKATGPHLHFEVRVGNDPQDPLKYVK